MASSPEVIRARTSAKMQRMAATRRAQAVANDDACELCHEPIDYDALPRTTRSWSLEHRVSMKQDISRAFDPTNHGSAHYSCNARAGQVEGTPTGRSASTEPQSIAW